MSIPWPLAQAVFLVDAAYAFRRRRDITTTMDVYAKDRPLTREGSDPF